jgi:hypothetical protein
MQPYAWGAAAGQPEFSTSPVFGADQQRAALNSITGSNDAEAANQYNQALASRSGNGFAASSASPVMQNLKRMLDSQAQIQNQQAKTQLPLQFGQANADQAFRTGQARQGQWGAAQQFGLGQGQLRLGALNPILQLLGQFAA